MIIYSELSIPHGDDRAVLWRLLLMDFHSKISYSRILHEHLEAKKKGIPIEEGFRQLLVQVAKSGDFRLNEIEIGILLLTSWTLGADALSEPAVRYLGNGGFTDRQLSPEELECTRRCLKKFGQHLLLREIPKMRAKLAVQELVAVLSPDEMIPYLIGLSPRYLQCRNVRSWIQQQKRLQRGVKSDLGKSNLKKVFCAVSGNPRAKKRIYPYWKLGLIYESLYEAIRRLRRDQKKGFSVKTNFDRACILFEIPSEYHNLVLDSKIAKKQLSLDIMVARGLLNDSKVILDIQRHTGAIVKKYSAGSILEISNRISPLVFELADFPGFIPSVIEEHDPFAVLELLPIQKTGPNS
jgi:hypothetical protein